MHRDAPRKLPSPYGWEQRRKLPDAPARAYLTVIARNPQAVAELLGEAA
jgi:putative transcriptional regulator